MLTTQKHSPHPSKASCVKLGSKEPTGGWRQEVCTCQSGPRKIILLFLLPHASF